MAQERRSITGSDVVFASDFTSEFQQLLRAVEGLAEPEPNLIRTVGLAELWTQHYFHSHVFKLLDFVLSSKGEKSHPDRKLDRDHQPDLSPFGMKGTGFKMAPAARSQRP